MKFIARFNIINIINCIKSDLFKKVKIKKYEKIN